MKILKILFLYLILCVSILNIPVYAKEREGTKVELTAAEVADLKVWVDNAKTNLQNLLDQIRYLSSSEKLITMQLEFNRIVNESSKKDNELYIRYVLNRALTVEEIIFDYKNNPIPTNLEQEMVLALFTKSINMALTLYVDDKAYLEAIGKGETPKQTKHMAVFGFEYAELLINDAKTLLNPHLEYLVTRTALGFLGNDLNSSRNLDRILFHDEILHIQQLLAIYGPTSPADDQQAIQQIRRMKFTYRENVRNAVNAHIKSIEDLQKEIINAEYRKQLLAKETEEEKQRRLAEEEKNRKQAEEHRRYLEQVEKEGLFKIDNPHIYGISISSRVISPDAVCNLLGYAKAVENSIRDSDTKSNDALLKVDENMKITVSDDWYYPITSIICNDKLKNKVMIPKFQRIINPVYNSNNSEFHFSSRGISPDAVCNLLGYAKAVENSIRDGDTRSYDALLKVDENMKIAVSDDWYYPITSIMCFER